jgi:hypothetical protein
MNTSNITLDADALQARFALRIAAALDERAAAAPRDIDERLRFARERALQRAKQVRVEAASAAVHTRGGTLGLGGGWWLRLASVLPLLMLIGGLTLIQLVHDRAQIAAAAEIDTALLADSLPPDAYRDPGFVEFLKTPQ